MRRTQMGKGCSTQRLRLALLFITVLSVQYTSSSQAGNNDHNERNQNDVRHDAIDESRAEGIQPIWDRVQGAISIPIPSPSLKAASSVGRPYFDSYEPYYNSLIDFLGLSEKNLQKGTNAPDHLFHASHQQHDRDQPKNAQKPRDKIIVDEAQQASSPVELEDPQATVEESGEVPSKDEKFVDAIEEVVEPIETLKTNPSSTHDTMDHSSTQETVAPVKTGQDEGWNAIDGAEDKKVSDDLDASSHFDGSIMLPEVIENDGSESMHDSFPVLLVTESESVGLAVEPKDTGESDYDHDSDNTLSSSPFEETETGENREDSNNEATTTTNDDDHASSNPAKTPLQEVLFDTSRDNGELQSGTGDKHETTTERRNYRLVGSDQRQGNESFGIKDAIDDLSGQARDIETKYLPFELTSEDDDGSSEQITVDKMMEDFFNSTTLPQENHDYEELSYLSDQMDDTGQATRSSDAGEIKNEEPTRQLLESAAPTSALIETRKLHSDEKELVENSSIEQSDPEALQLTIVQLDQEAMDSANFQSGPPTEIESEPNSIASIDIGPTTEAAEIQSSGAVSDCTMVEDTAEITQQNNSTTSLAGGLDDNDEGHHSDTKKQPRKGSIAEFFQKVKAKEVTAMLDEGSVSAAAVPTQGTSVVDERIQNDQMNVKDNDDNVQTSASKPPEVQPDEFRNAASLQSQPDESENDSYHTFVWGKRRFTNPSSPLLQVAQHNTGHDTTHETATGDEVDSLPSSPDSTAAAKDGEALSDNDIGNGFVSGLDDIDKFFEPVDPPDELDIGAHGSSIQEILMGQGGQILRKHLMMGMKHIRGLFRRRSLDEESDTPNEETTGAIVPMEVFIHARERLFKACRKLFRMILDAYEDLFEAETEDAGDLLFTGEQQRLNNLKRRMESLGLERKKSRWSDEDDGQE